MWRRLLAPYLDASEFLLPRVEEEVDAHRLQHAEGTVQSPQAGGAQSAQGALHHLVELEQPEAVEGVHPVQAEQGGGRLPQVLVTARPLLAGGGVHFALMELHILPK